METDFSGTSASKLLWRDSQGVSPDLREMSFCWNCTTVGLWRCCCQTRFLFEWQRPRQPILCSHTAEHFAQMTDIPPLVAIVYG